MNIDATKRVAVRGPFRAMGAAIAVLGALVLLSQGYRLIFARPPDQLQTSDLLFIPGMAWLIRLCWFSARTRSTPEEFPSWPFATERVFGVYWALCCAVWWFGR
jgi:hypothetical protein